MQLPVSKDGRRPLLVIGAGLGRTGTTSLKCALEILYGQPCYHGSELIEHRREQYNAWLEIDQELTDNGHVGEDRFHAVYEGYRCAVDIPTCCYYEQLMDTYPDAKVILSVRNAADWLRSCRRTILPRHSGKKIGWAANLVQRFTLGWQIRQLLRTCRRRSLGPECDLNDDEAVIEAYEAWNQSVRETVPADRLLVFDVQEGWGPLCRFLDLPVPEQEFPKTNPWMRINEYQVRMKRRTRWLQWGASMGLLFGLIISTAWYNSLWG